MYIVEGTIGAGKSTFLKLLKDYFPHLSIKFEPVDSWQSDVVGKSLLTFFYEHPRRWAYTMETFTMMKRMSEQLQENPVCAPTIVERSIYSGHYVFARNSYENGFMTDMEWQLYSQWFEFLTKKCVPPRGFIYLKVDPLKAFERIKKRKRMAEDSLPLDYLYQIEKQHERFLCHKENIVPQLKPVPVLVLDCNEEFEDDPRQFEMQCAKIEEFLK